MLLILSKLDIQNNMIDQTLNMYLISNNDWKNHVKLCDIKIHYIYVLNKNGIFKTNHVY